MMQSIGIMIGFYIFLRCVSFAARTGERSEPKIVRIFSAFTAVITLLLMATLLGSRSP